MARGTVGNHTPPQVIHGDCMKVLHTFANTSIDIAFTSPPYNRKRNDKYANYDDTVDDWYGWMCKVIDELMRLTTRYVFFNVQKNYYNKADVFRIMGKYADKLQEVIVWEKSNPMPASGKAITNSYEYILVLSNMALKSNTTYTKNIITTSVYSKMPKNHRAVMHPDVSDWVIDKLTAPDDIIIDPFMGLGTTGVSCKKFGRDFIGIEKDEEYFNEALERIGAERGK